MRKILAIAILAASLGGCVTDDIAATLKATTGFSVSQNQIDATRETYVGFLKGVAQYGGYPRCLTGQTFFSNGCHDASTLKSLQGTKNSVRDGLASVQAHLDQGDRSGALTAFNTVKATLTTGQGILASFGIKVGS